MSRAAALAFALVLTGGLVVGEVFPLSRFDMYARAAGRREGAVPLVLADDRAVEIEALRDFSGIDAATLLPPGLRERRVIVAEGRAWPR